MSVLRLKTLVNLSETFTTGNVPAFICGQERDLLLVGCPDNISGAISINSYDLKNRSKKFVYKLDASQSKLIGCTVNEERNLIAYTICKSPNTEDESYESWVVDLNSGESAFLSRSRELQRVQFVTDTDVALAAANSSNNQTNSSTQNAAKRYSYLLLFISEDSINVWQVSQRGSTAYSSSSHKSLGGSQSKFPPPVQKTILVKNFIWAEWDTRKGLLYAITLRQTSRRDSQMAGEYVFKCYSFPNATSGRLSSLFVDRDEREASLHFEVPLQMKWQKGSKPDALYLYPFSLPDQTSPQLFQYLHVVNLGHNRICLCQQHRIDDSVSGTSANSYSLDISIYMLHFRTLMNISVPIVRSQSSSSSNSTSTSSSNYRPTSVPPSPSNAHHPGFPNLQRSGSSPGGLMTHHNNTSPSNSAPSTPSDHGKSSHISPFRFFTRTFFDSIGEMLLVYIPGHHFQMIDVAHEHGPMQSFSLPSSNVDLSLESRTLNFDEAPSPELTSINNSVGLNNSSNNINSNNNNSLSTPKSRRSGRSEVSSERSRSEMSQQSRSEISQDDQDEFRSPYNNSPVSQTSINSSQQLQQSNNEAINRLSSSMMMATVPPSSIVSYDILSRPIENSLEPDLRGHTMLDCVTGTLYEYIVDREALLKLFDLNPSSLALQNDVYNYLMHFAVVHLQDSELTAQILSHLCSNRSTHNLNPQLLREYILATSYRESLRRLRGSGVNNSFERFLPMTTIDTISVNSSDALKPKRISKNIVVSMMAGYTNIPGTKIQFKEREDERRFLLNVSTLSPVPSFSSSPVTNTNLASSGYFNFQTMNVQTTNPKYSQSSSSTPSPVPTSAANFSSSYSNYSSNSAASSPIPTSANSATSPPPLKFFRDLFGLDNSSTVSSSNSPIPMQYNSRQEHQKDQMGPYMLQLHQQHELSNAPRQRGSSAPVIMKLSMKDQEALLARRQVLESLTSFLTQYFPKDKNCFSVSRDYCSTEELTVGQLLRTAREACFDGGSLNLAQKFRIYQFIFDCLEEQYFPHPPEFNEDFIRLGFKYLSRNVFLQYLNRGIFVPDEKFVRQVCTTAAANLQQQQPIHQNQQNSSLEIQNRMKQDSSSGAVSDLILEMALLSKVNDARICVEVMRELVPQAHPSLVQYAVSTMPSRVLKELLMHSNITPLDMEVSDHSPFIPLALFEQFARRDKHYLDNDFLADTVGTVFEHSLHFDPLPSKQLQQQQLQQQQQQQLQSQQQQQTGQSTQTTQTTHQPIQQSNSRVNLLKEGGTAASKKTDSSDPDDTDPQELFARKFWS